MFVIIEVIEYSELFISVSGIYSSRVRCLKFVFFVVVEFVIKKLII